MDPKASDSLSSDCKWLSMPPEMTLKVFSYLGRFCLLQAGATCQTWYRLSRDPSLWTRLEIDYENVPARRRGEMQNNFRSSPRMSSFEEFMASLDSGYVPLDRKLTVIVRLPKALKSTYAEPWMVVPVFRGMDTLQSGGARHDSAPILRNYPGGGKIRAVKFLAEDDDADSMKLTYIFSCLEKIQIVALVVPAVSSAMVKPSTYIRKRKKERNQTKTSSRAHHPPPIFSSCQLDVLSSIPIILWQTSGQSLDCPVNWHH